MVFGYEEGKVVIYFVDGLDARVFEGRQSVECVPHQHSFVCLYWRVDELVASNRCPPAHTRQVLNVPHFLVHLDGIKMPLVDTRENVPELVVEVSYLFLFDV